MSQVGISGPSRAAVCSGNAIHKAAVLAREQVLETASEMFEAAKDDLELGDGKVWVRGVEDRAVEARVLGEDRRHLPRLDAQAADLDLVVDPPEGLLEL